MGAVQDRLVITDEEAREYLRVDAGDDSATLSILLDAAKEQADLYLNNPFLDEDGNELPIPERVKMWCLQWCARQYTHRGLGLSEQSIDDLGGSKWNNTIQDYSLIRTLRLVPGLGY